MDTVQLYTALQKLFCGDHRISFDVIPSDYLDTYPIQKLPLYLIVNSEDHRNAGKHWLAIAVHKHEIFFFDSYGYPITKYSSHFVNFLRRLHALKFIQKYQRIQCYGSSTCGPHCCFFLYKLYRGNHPDTIYAMYNRNNCKLNDKYIEQWLKLALLMSKTYCNINKIKCIQSCCKFNKA